LIADSFKQLVCFICKHLKDYKCDKGRILHMLYIKTPTCASALLKCLTMKCVSCCLLAGVSLRGRVGNGIQRYDNRRMSTYDKEQ